MRACVCVCVRERERVKERGRETCMIGAKCTDWSVMNSCSSIILVKDKMTSLLLDPSVKVKVNQLWPPPPPPCLPHQIAIYPAGVLYSRRKHTFSFPRDADLRRALMHITCNEETEQKHNMKPGTQKGWRVKPGLTCRFGGRQSLSALHAHSFSTGGRRAEQTPTFIQLAGCRLV